MPPVAIPLRRNRKKGCADNGHGYCTVAPWWLGEETMSPIERRDFMRGAATGALGFTVGGVEVFLSAREARAQNVPFRLLKANEAETIEALGETMVPGARAAGIAHFIDQQLSVPPGEALLEARILNVRPAPPPAADP